MNFAVTAGAAGMPEQFVQGRSVKVLQKRLILLGLETRAVPEDQSNLCL